MLTDIMNLYSKACQVEVFKETPDNLLSRFDVGDKLVRYDILGHFNTSSFSFSEFL